MFFNKAKQLRKDEPAVDACFRASDFWGKNIRGFDSKRYYVHVFCPSMKHFSVIAEHLATVKSELAARTILRILNNDVKYFSAVTEKLIGTHPKVTKTEIENTLLDPQVHEPQK